MNESMLMLQELDVRHTELLENLSVLDAEIHRILQEWNQVSAEVAPQITDVAA